MKKMIPKPYYRACEIYSVITGANEHEDHRGVTSSAVASPRGRPDNTSERSISKRVFYRCSARKSVKKTPHIGYLC